jgi:hypothetical protein
LLSAYPTYLLNKNGMNIVALEPMPVAYFVNPTVIPTLQPLIWLSQKP